jgi:hypothetical protein
MRIDLLGLQLDAAKAVLAGEGISPEITVTHAPKRADEARGTLRVVFASDDGAKLTVARFLDPIEEGDRKTDEDGE